MFLVFFTNSKERHDLSWLCIKDFNEITTVDEKIG